MAKVHGKHNQSKQHLVDASSHPHRDAALSEATERRTEFMRIMAEEGTVSKFESQIYRRDGSVIWISEYARAVHDDDGVVLYYEGTVEDITERKRAEAQIQSQAALLDKARDAIMAIELDGTLRLWNRGAEAIYGWSRAEMIRRALHDLFEVAQRARISKREPPLPPAVSRPVNCASSAREGREVIVESQPGRWCGMTRGIRSRSS
ncbi:MAG: PAS domain-containing protein [Chthoniobacteraceae bacterium]